MINKKTHNPINAEFYYHLTDEEREAWKPILFIQISSKIGNTSASRCGLPITPGKKKKKKVRSRAKREFPLFHNKGMLVNLPDVQGRFVSGFVQIRNNYLKVLVTVF